MLVLDCSKVPAMCWYFKQSMGTRNWVGLGLLYRPARARICKPFKEPGIDSQTGGPVWQPYLLHRLARAGIFEQFMGARNLGGIGLLYWPARLHRLAEFTPWNQFMGSLNVYKYGLRLHWLAELVPWNQFLGSITWRPKTKMIFFGSKRRKTNIFVSQLTKGWWITNLFVPKLYIKERRQTKVFVPQLAKEGRRSEVFVPQL